jgi:arylsulfatase A-like enzyme
MNLRTLGGGLLCGASLTLCAPMGDAAAKSPGPNLVFILADDLGKEWISAYGAEDIRTPNIDALAAGGMRFENAYAMPQCTPSRIALLTGKYPFRNGWVNHWDAPRWGDGYFDWKHPENTTVFQLLQRLGYKTAAAGKWQINDFRKEPDAMTRHGFDDWFMWTGYEDGNPASDLRYRDPYIHTREGSKTYSGKFGPDLYSDFLIQFMRKHKDEPFCLYYAMALPHDPFTTTPDEPKAVGNLEKHKAMVRYMDKMVGKLVAALDEAGVRDDTILVFTTDNGSTSSITGRRNGRPVSGAKMKLDETGACMPFIVNGPGLVPAGVVTDALTDFTDLLPTFVDLAGGTLPADFVTDGASLAPLLLGKATDSPRNWILSMGGFPGVQDDKGIRNVKKFAPRVLRDKQYKVWVSEQKQITRLHDLRADPWEETNLLNSSDPGHQAAHAKFEAVVKTLPDRDARPVYTRRPGETIVLRQHQKKGKGSE